MTMSGSGSLSFNQCQKLTDKTLSQVLSFAENIDSLKPSAGFLNPILKLDELRIRVNKATNRFLTDNDIIGYITPMVTRIINWRPRISNQLRNFWQAQNDIGIAALAAGSQYDPLEMANKTLKKIVAVNKVYLSVSDAIHANPNDKNYLYSLFYAQMLSTETAEYVFREHFTNLLKTYGLDRKYDAIEIFSVDTKVAKGQNYKTDSRAIRDSLGHYQYEIEDVPNTWEIKFNNLKDGYNFTPIFTRDEFRTHVETADLLYKSQAYLVWLYIGSATVSAAFKL